MSTSGLNTAGTGNVSRTKGQTTAITGSTSSAETRVQAMHPGTNIRNTWSNQGTKRVGTLNAASTRSTYSRHNATTLQVLLVPLPKVVRSNSHSWDHLRMLSAKYRYEHYRHGAQMVRAYSIIRVFWEFPIDTIWGSRVCTRSTRSTNGRVPASTYSTRRAEPRNTSSTASIVMVIMVSISRHTYRSIRSNEPRTTASPLSIRSAA